MNFSKPIFEKKILSPEELIHKLNEIKKNKPLVFTNGCFDIIHRGHVTYLSQAKQLGNALIVALNTDNSIKSLNKGSERPINKLSDRLAVVASLQSVDFVTYFDSFTPLELIVKINPEVLVKGGDWSIADIVGSKEILEKGGKVFSIPFLHELSTTKIVRQIREK